MPHDLPRVLPPHCSLMLPSCSLSSLSSTMAGDSLCTRTSARSCLSSRHSPRWQTTPCTHISVLPHCSLMLQSCSLSSSQSKMSVDALHTHMLTILFFSSSQSTMAEDALHTH
jgi:hypothetical protein